MAANAHKSKPENQLPQDLAEVALIEAATCAAAGAMSVSWWHQCVRDGQAPAPVIRLPRCTRWRRSDVIDFWANFAQRSLSNPETGAAVIAKAKKASRAAQVKRLAVQKRGEG